MKYEKKKIAHLSDYDFLGGSAFYSYRTHKNILKHTNHLSKMFVLFKNTKDKSIESFNFEKNNYLKNKLEFFLLSEKNKYSFYNKGRYVINHLHQVEKLLKFKPNFVIIYNNSNFINPKLIYKIQKLINIKFLFYLMDMEPLTGGCHYNFSCNGYQKKCSECPAVKKVINYIPKNNLNIKKKYIGKTRITFISPNKKVLNNVYKSNIYSKKLHKNILLHLGLDLNFYKPLRKYNKKIVFAFRSSLNPRKGQTHITNSLLYIFNNYSEYVKKIKFNVLGDRSVLKLLDKLGFIYSFKSSIKNEKSLLNFYQSSDFFINQSTQDLGPFMVNESLACGIPVISFKEGVSVDLVKNGYNGFLINNFSSKDLAKKIINITNMKKSKIKKFKKNSRITANKFLHFKKQIIKIIK